MNKQVEKIKKEVLEEEFYLTEDPELEFGVKDKKQVMRLLDLIHSRVIELTIQKTAREIFKELEANNISQDINDCLVIEGDTFAELKKKWGVSDD